MYIILSVFLICLTLVIVLLSGGNGNVNPPWDGKNRPPAPKGSNPSKYKQ